MKEFFKKLYNKIFRKNQLNSPNEQETMNNIENNKREDFYYDLKKAANPEICDGNGYGIKKIKNIKELI